MKIITDKMIYRIDKDNEQEIINILKNKPGKTSKRFSKYPFKPGDKADITRMYYQEGLSLRQIGVRYKTSRTTVQNFMNKNNMPRRDKGGKKLYDEQVEELRILYCHKHMTVDELAHRFNICPATMSIFLRKHNIKKKYERQAAKGKRKALPTPAQNKLSIDEVIAKYETSNLIDTAKSMNVSLLTLLRFMNRHNIERRRRGKVPKK